MLCELTLYGVLPQKLIDKGRTDIILMVERPFLESKMRNAQESVRVIFITVPEEVPYEKKFAYFIGKRPTPFDEMVWDKVEKEEYEAALRDAEELQHFQCGRLILSAKVTSDRFWVDAIGRIPEVTMISGRIREIPVRVTLEEQWDSQYLDALDASRVKYKLERVT